MLRNRLPLLLTGYLSGVLTCLMVSCSNGPKVRVHISDPKINGMEYYDQVSGQSGFTPYSETDKFICFNPPDLQTLLGYCGAVQK